MLAWPARASRGRGQTTQSACSACVCVFLAPPAERGQLACKWPRQTCAWPPGRDACWALFRSRPKRKFTVVLAVRQSASRAAKEAAGRPTGQQSAELLALNWIGSALLGLDWIEYDWIGLDWIGGRSVLSAERLGLNDEARSPPSSSLRANQELTLSDSRRSEEKP